LLGRTDHRRAFLPVADRRDPRSRDARCDEDVFCRLGAALPECQIVFAGAPLVAMTLDRDRDIRVTPQPICLPSEDLPRFRRDVRSVEREKDTVARTRLQILLRPRDDVARAHGASPTRWTTGGPGRRLRGCAAAGDEHHQDAQQADYFCMHLIPLTLSEIHYLPFQILPPRRVAGVPL